MITVTCQEGTTAYEGFPEPTLVETFLFLAGEGLHRPLFRILLARRAFQDSEALLSNLIVSGDSLLLSGYGNHS